MISIFASLLQKSQQFLVVRFEGVNLDLQVSVAFSRHIEVIHGRLKVRHLLPKSVILPTFQLHLLLDIVVPSFYHPVFRIEMDDLIVALLEHTLNTIDLLLTLVDFGLLFL